jgi:hypothetical protein
MNTSRVLFTIVGGAVLINPAFAQNAQDQDQSQGEVLEEVVVTGLRGSLQASMTTKREAIGVVDSINAEDIGKFPDTNLSEALQRITGVSIDRRNGEGATVTARHEPTGTQSTAVTGSDGRFALLNVRVGGPYVIKASLSGFQEITKGDVFVRLGNSASRRAVEQATLTTSISRGAKRGSTPSRRAMSSMTSASSTTDGPTTFKRRLSGTSTERTRTSTTSSM